MPFYLYECGNCERTGEYLVNKVGDTPEKCDYCSAPASKLERTFAGQTIGVKTSGTQTNSRPPIIIRDITCGVCGEQVGIGVNIPIRISKKTRPRPNPRDLFNCQN